MELTVGATVLGALICSTASVPKPSNVCMQRPQRTFPDRFCSCTGVTRKSVLHRGQRVTRLTARASRPTCISRP